jgi:hypothetical protein
MESCRRFRGQGEVALWETRQGAILLAEIRHDKVPLSTVTETTVEIRILGSSLAKNFSRPSYTRHRLGFYPALCRRQYHHGKPVIGQRLHYAQKLFEVHRPCGMKSGENNC